MEERNLRILCFLVLTLSLRPKTFEISVNINNISSIMIFQEDSQKALLERNLRREGPIFEGDESYLLSNKPDNIDYTNNLSLARLINSKWILKGKSSQYIALSSFDPDLLEGGLINIKISNSAQQKIIDENLSLFYIYQLNEKYKIFYLLCY